VEVHVVPPPPVRKTAKSIRGLGGEGRGAAAGDGLEGWLMSDPGRAGLGVTRPHRGLLPVGADIVVGAADLDLVLVCGEGVDFAIDAAIHGTPGCSIPAGDSLGGDTGHGGEDAAGDEGVV